MRVPYNVSAAFREPINLLFLFIAGMVFLASGFAAWDVVFTALAVELGYMLFVPDTRWYKGVLGAREMRLRQRERAQLKRETLPALAPPDRNRFLRLEALRNRMPSASAAGFGREEMATVYHQMDVLLDHFLNFAAKSAQYRAYIVDMVRPSPGPAAPGSHWIDRLFDMASNLITERQDAGLSPVGGASTRRASDIQLALEQVQKTLDDKITQMRAAVEAQTNEPNRRVMEKNLEVLAKRRERVGELGNIITNLECQLDLIEATFGLISDQVHTLAPEQVIHDINDVVLQTETTTQLLAASAPLEFQLKRLDRTLA